MKNLQEFDTLEDARAERIVKSKLLSGSVMKRLIIAKGLFGYFIDHTADLQRAVAWELRGGDFDLMEGSKGSVLEFFDYMISIEPDSTTKTLLGLLQDDCIKEANEITYPFADVTPEQFAACEEAYSEITVKHDEWNRHSSLKITLHEDLYEPKRVTLFYSNNVFTNENVGRPRLMHKAGVYGIDLTGAQKTGTLHVNFGIKANATIELI